MSNPINMARDVALTGLGVRLPGPDGQPVRGPAHLWHTLLSGESALGRYPHQRWEPMAELLHPDDRPEGPWPVAALETPEHLEHAYFGLPAAEAAHLSATQRLVLEVGAEAIEDAGLDPASLAGPGTGLYVGSASPDEAIEAFAAPARTAFAGLPAGGAGMLATPLSRWLDARGPLMTTDTSCSSALYALDAAARDVADDRVDTAVVIGVNTARTPGVGRAFADGPVLASGEASRPFDAGADGFVRGEGIVALVLRRYAHARRSRDRIYATVAATRTGADGASPGTGMPSFRAQAALWDRALSGAGIAPEEVDHVQAHGTATRAGDGAEIRALGQAFQTTGRPEHDPLWVGSTKGTFGHTEGGAGLVGVAAAALSLHHGRIPPTAGHRTPNPLLAKHHLRVATAPVDWSGYRVAPRHAGVASLGFSGAIAVALLRQTPPARPDEADHGKTGVWALSGADRAGLAEQAGRLHTAITTGEHAPALARVGAHLARRTDQSGPWRAAVLATAGTEPAGALQALAYGQAHPDLIGPAQAQPGAPLVWAFGGHGAARPHMGARLYRADALFASHLDRACAAVDAQTGRAWHPNQGPPEGLAHVQQATWMMQVALAATLTERYGLVPEAVVGHSLGEVAAAHVAGALDLHQAAAVVAARSQLLERIAPGGGMCSVEIDAAGARALSDEHGVEVAASNAPRLHVLSGPSGQLAAAQAAALHQGRTVRILPDAPPAHSRAVEPVLDELTDRLHGLVTEKPAITMVSTVTAAPVTDLGAGYWRRQLRAPVDFEAAVIGLAQEGPVLVGELSPRPVLAVPMAQTSARHHLPLQVSALGEDEVQGPARMAAWAHTHGRAPVWGHRAHPPVELVPRTWNAQPPADHLADLAGLGPEQAREQLTEIVHRSVADLAPVDVGRADRDRPLEELGLNSMSRLSLRTHVLSLLGPRAAEAAEAAEAEHTPTINGIAQALAPVLLEHEPTAGGHP